MSEKCNNLEASVNVLDAREDGRKRNHKHAMEEAHRMCATLQQQLAALDKEAEKLWWERRKHATTVAKEKVAVGISKWGVEHEEKKVARKAVAVTRREDVLIGQEVALGKKQAFERHGSRTSPCEGFGSFVQFLRGIRI